MGVFEFGKYDGTILLAVAKRRDYTDRQDAVSRHHLPGWCPMKRNLE